MKTISRLYRSCTFGANHGLLISAIGCLLNTGCGSRQEFVPVSGIITLAGKPAAGLRVEFHPDPDHATMGPSSYAETDAEGKFVLQYSDPQRGETMPGVLAGWHRVIILDILASQSGGGPNSINVRFPLEYLSMQTTPLILEVQTGTPTLNITIP